MNPITAEIKKAFIDLVCRLSPENLACDGEISKTEIDRRYRQILKEWKVLEAKVGRKVSEEEAEKWSLELPLCPLCNKQIERGRSALSRKVKGMKICAPCATTEALYGFHTKEA